MPNISLSSLSHIRPYSASSCDHRSYIDKLHVWSFHIDATSNDRPICDKIHRERFAPSSKILPFSKKPEGFPNRLVNGHHPTLNCDILQFIALFDIDATITGNYRSMFIAGSMIYSRWEVFNPKKAKGILPDIIWFTGSEVKIQQIIFKQDIHKTVVFRR